MMYEHIDVLIAEAMKSRDTERAGTLRLIKAAFLNFKTQKNAPALDQAAEINILKKMVSQRKDSIEQYIMGNRPELVKKEQDEIDIIQEFLPPETTPEEIDAKILEYMRANHFTVIPKNCMGICIKFVKGYYPTADGKMVSEMVKKYL